MNEILKYDSEFVESKFITYVNNVFIQIHMAIVTKQLENIRHFVSQSVYEMLEKKVNTLDEKHLTQMYDEINVAETKILNYAVEDNKIVIKLNIISRYIDYLIDESGNYVSGNMSSRIQKNNYLTFTKSINCQQAKNVNRCPGCGASIDVNASGKCPYCGTIYNLQDTNWILSEIQIN